MSTTLLPPATNGIGTSGPGGTPPRPPDDDHGPRRRRPPRGSLAVLMTVTALLGGAASTGVLALAGAFDGNVASPATTTTLPVSSGGGSSPGSNAKAVYAGASAGVVNITATGTSQSAATGSGFVVDRQGHIVTAAHVVNGASSIKVAFADGTTRAATLAGKDEATDVAVLEVDPSGLTLHPLAIGSSASLQVGDAVAAIGSPFGYQESLSTGVVSGLDRTISAPNGYSVAHALQTDAALNPGNSGGPILDSSGRVVGIADQIATGGSADQGSGVGFAVPIDLVANELTQLEAGQAVHHAYLGVKMSDATGGTTGAHIASVVSGGPAAGSGLRAGDTVTAIDGKTLSGPSDVVAAVAGHKPGDQVKLTVRTGSATRTVTVTLGTQPTTRSPSALG